MSHVILRGSNWRRHEVDFGDDLISVSIHASEEVVQIFIEADGDGRPEERRRFALVNLPRHLFSAAIADLARKTACRCGDQCDVRRTDCSGRDDAFAMAARRTAAEIVELPSVRRLAVFIHTARSASAG